VDIAVDSLGVTAWNHQIVLESAKCYSRVVHAVDLEAPIECDPLVESSNDRAVVLTDRKINTAASFTTSPEC
jgi:hypothetical protein